MPHMEARDVPFHLPYGSLICTKRLHSDRPKCGGMLANPRAFQNHAEIGSFVPGFNHTYLIGNFKIFISLDSPRSPLSNEISKLISSKKWLSERPNCWGIFLRLRGMTVVEWCENRGCFSLSGCHLAVSQSWAGYHTSSERGHSGLSADIRIKSVVQMEGII